MRTPPPLLKMGFLNWTTPFNVLYYASATEQECNAPSRRPESRIHKYLASPESVTKPHCENVSPDPSTNAKDGLIQRPAADCLHTLPVQMTAILTKHLPTTHSSMYYVLNLKHYLSFFFGGAELFLRHILSLLDNKKKC